MVAVPVRRRSPKWRAAGVAARLAEAYPEAICELDHRNPFELLVATILSAQSTDARVNLVTPVLFERYPTPAALAAADPSEVEQIVLSTGFYAAKTRNLLGMSNALLEQFAGDVPSGLEELVMLPGVGRKTANVIRVVAFGLPGLPVDTHVKRLALRLRLTESDDPAVVEQDLCGLLRRADWGPFGLRLILHGRRVCHAKRPACESCAVADLCPSAVT